MKAKKYFALNGLPAVVQVVIQDLMPGPQCETKCQNIHVLSHNASHSHRVKQVPRMHVCAHAGCLVKIKGPMSWLQ